MAKVINVDWAWFDHWQRDGRSFREIAVDTNGEWLSLIHHELMELALILNVAAKSRSSRQWLLRSAGDLISGSYRDLRQLRRLTQMSDINPEDLAELLTKRTDEAMVFTWRCLRCASVLIESNVHIDTPVIKLKRLVTRDRQLVRLALTRHTCPPG